MISTNTCLETPPVSTLRVRILVEPLGAFVGVYSDTSNCLRGRYRLVPLRVNIWEFRGSTCEAEHRIPQPYS